MKSAFLALLCSFAIAFLLIPTESTLPHRRYLETTLEALQTRLQHFRDNFAARVPEPSQSSEAPPSSPAAFLGKTTRIELAEAMSVARGIAKVFKAIEQAEGAGARVRRSIGTPKLRNFSPFLMLDHFTIGAGAGFPDHPHRYGSPYFACWEAAH